MTSPVSESLPLIQTKLQRPLVPVDQFSRFQRGPDAYIYTGCGLGLAIVKAIADQHRATLDVQRKSIGAQRL